MRPHWLILFVLVTLLAGTVPAAAQPATAFQAAPCQFVVPKALRITCGFLVVPEDRAAPNGRQIRLAVAIAKTARSPRQADPVIYLAGGPGSAAVATTPGLAQGWASFLAHRDLIVIDQRGTGFSQPSLACTAQDAEPPTAAQTPDDRAAAEYRSLIHCRDRLVGAGVQLGAYTTAASAEDLRDLRQALGYSRWNLFGISYGTRLALAAARADPGGVRSLILDSAYPPQANLFTAMPSSLDHSLQKLYADCAASVVCQRLTPDLRTTLEQLVAQLDAQPIDLVVANPSGQPLTVRVDGTRLIEIVFRSLYQTALIPQLPRAIVTAANGDYRLITQFETKRQERSAGHSAALYYAVECAEDLATTSVTARQKAAAQYPLLAGYYRSVQEFTPASADLCAAWAAPPPSAETTATVESAVPTLVLSGDYDPITPPAWADATVASLPRSEVYHVAGTGHAVITRGACPRQMIGAFLDTFSAARAASCLSAFGPPAFLGP